MSARTTDEDRDAAVAPRGEPAATLEPIAPDPIEVGGGTAVVVEGTLDASHGPVDLRLGAIERPVDAQGVEGDAEHGRWWSVVPIPAGTPAGMAELELIAGGGVERIALGQVTLAAGEPVAREPEMQGDPLIAICMATHEPPPDRLRRQLDSIREQSWGNWVCVISDDRSSPGAFAEIERAVAGDSRFVVSRAPERLGFLRNFERAIRLAPPEAALLALADQDDRWFPDKLAALAETLERNPRAQLAYSDMRITDGEGRVLSDTYWYLRRNRCDDMASMLVANSVTGAAAMFRRELLADALPFPPAHPTQLVYHDHWLALCALATGEIAYLDRPTYDYFRHDDSITVLEAPDWLRPASGVAGRARLFWRRLTRRIRMGSRAPSWERVYRERWLLLRQLITILDLRLAGRIGVRQRRDMDRLMAAERSPAAVAWLVLRCLRPLIGRNETLARERILLGGLIWRWSGGRSGRRAARRP
jgi:glycosyltransferase involved in cell wall biosynthesis